MTPVITNSDPPPNVRDINCPAQPCRQTKPYFTLMLQVWNDQKDIPNRAEGLGSLDKSLGRPMKLYHSNNN